MRTIWILAISIALLVMGCQPVADQRVSFFFAGHQDDWQLFMGDKAYEAVQNGDRTVFVITTAGDASLGLSIGEGANRPYYLTREQAVVNSAMLAADGLGGVDENSRSTTPLRDYELDRLQLEVSDGGSRRTLEINFFDYKNTRTYLLRLPDGFPRGQYPVGMYQLRTGKTNNLFSIDSLISVDHWDKLVGVVQAIVEHESSGMEEIWINAAERDSTLNPGDHFDHLHASLLADEASKNLCANKRYFVEYHTAELPVNLDEEVIRVKKWLFSPCAISKEASGYQTSWDEFHLAWTERSYYREVLCQQSKALMP